uniref:Small ribosomal subunit protein uS3c n=1 Tax=Gloeochaete wittrockiana TaxID=38269 RepID=A0A3G1IW93_9EUKA|nr:ribosomal protein S3 [Gloeochaete wittrockiana]ASQ40219.1 ribosomal protein S3 [Gloeochaete wittrockiana]
MGQKTHPIAFRLGITKKHLSQWYACKNSYSSLIEEDYKIREYIKKNYPNSGITDVQIKRLTNQVQVEIKTASPSAIIAAENNGTNKLRAALKKLIQPNLEINLNIIELKHFLVDTDANLIAEYMAQRLEQRTVFKRVIRDVLKKAKEAKLKGIKIQISGRLNGSEIARSEWARKGRVPLQTLRANIDYSYRRAYTIYGVLGIKVWVFKGEVLGTK